MFDHRKFEELAALANSGSLTSDEWAEVKGHLAICRPCHDVFLQYRLLAEEELPILAAVHTQEQPAWDDGRTRSQLLARVQAVDHRTCGVVDKPVAARPSRTAAWPKARPSLLQAAIAACLVAAMGIAVHKTIRSGPEPKQVAEDTEKRLQELLTQKKSLNDLLEVQAARLSRLEADSLKRERELASLRVELRNAGERSTELMREKNESQVDSSVITKQRDSLVAALRETEQATGKLQADLASLRDQRDNALSQEASLEARMDELATANREQERRLKDTGQYLASDRDIRELMGARKLYIADVFDVDSGSRTKKPFGRVFYTQGKSLIFYAFDLDASPGLKNASAFQVWGKKEAAEGQRARALNLGILYMDSESNRRWVMRFDDPKQLAEIDAVFVTIEPHGGSQKPTGKPFLYALLRKELNHP